MTSSSGAFVRRLPLGAEVQPQGGVHFRLWAPSAQWARVVFEGGTADEDDELELDPLDDGTFEAHAAGASAGTFYRCRLSSVERLLPDPASRFQPDGPHGPSEIIDPLEYRWSDSSWRGRNLEGQVFYELHLGTFTPEGTLASAAAKLPHLRDLGATVVELMPVADFPGRFGWGYDGVNLFAPSRLYGRPDDLRGFVDRAHELGLAVLTFRLQFFSGYHGQERRFFRRECGTGVGKYGTGVAKCPAGGKT